MAPTSRKNIRKKTSSEIQDLEQRFPKMCLTPHQSTKAKSLKAKNQANKQRSPVLTSQNGKSAKIRASASAAQVNNDTEVIHPPLPYGLYVLIREAIEIMNRPEDSDKVEKFIDLHVTEIRIRRMVSYNKEILPSAWKYERENASSLLVGYDRVFKEDGDRFII